MVICAPDFYDVPGMSVFDILLWVSLRNHHDAPDTQLIAEDLHGLGNSLANTHPLSQRTEDLMGIGFLQFIIADILADKIMDILLLFQFCHSHRRTDQFLHPRLHGLLMIFDLIFIKQVLRRQFHISRIRIVPEMKSADKKDLRTIQAQFQKNIRQFLSLHPWTGKGRRQGLYPRFHGVIDRLLLFIHMAVIIRFHC